MSSVGMWGQGADTRPRAQAGIQDLVGAQTFLGIRKIRFSLGLGSRPIQLDQKQALAKMAHRAARPRSPTGPERTTAANPTASKVKALGAFAEAPGWCDLDPLSIQFLAINPP